MHEKKWWHDGFNVLWKRLTSEARLTSLSENRKEDLRWLIEEVEERAIENSGLQIKNNLDAIWMMLTIQAILMAMGFATIIFKII